MGKLDDKVAVLTGAASGIGEATAKLFAREPNLPSSTDTLSSSTAA